MNENFPALVTSRLRLRQIVPADAEALFAIHSDPECMRWYGLDPMTERQQAEQLAALFAAWFGANTDYRWALERHQDGQLIGSCGLFRWNKSWRSCTVGYELARNCQGHGYMREALTAALRYGFDEMELHRVQAETHPDNIASIGLLARLGFRFEGVHREQGFWVGSFHDLHCYSLLADDWNTVAN